MLTPIMTSNPDSEWQNASSSQGASKPPIKTMHLPTMEEIQGQDIWNNCAFRSVVSGVVGGGSGLVLGLFLGALDNNPSIQNQMTGRQQLIWLAKKMGQRSWITCKELAYMSFVFSATHGIVEKARGKQDITNTAVAGCVTGSAVYARGGPKATCFGCAGFAAFAVLMERILEEDT